MRLTRVPWGELDDNARRLALARPSLVRSDEIDDTVRRICSEVDEHGDDAVIASTERFDGVRLESFRVTDDEIAAAAAAIDREDRECLGRARNNIEVFHRLQRPRTVEVETEAGVFCRRVSRPIERVGLYVPGGSAPLVSTLLMLAVPARLAGCRERIVCTPPDRNGVVDPHILAAAELCEVTAVFKVGGAQAVAAMARGTESIPRVDKIFGPGNVFVAAAKLQVASRPGGPAIDFPAGPSEVLVVADGSAEPAFVAADLLSQAEHDESAQMILVTPSHSLADRVDDELGHQLADLPRREVAEMSLSGARAVMVKDLSEAVEVSNRYAPEHLILNCDGADELVESVRHAGSVFVGPWSAEAFGDYASGTNHVLPTYGSARTYGGLTLESFCKTMTVQRLTDEGLEGLGPTVERLARLEGLDAHARAVGLRRSFLRRRMSK